MFIGLPFYYCSTFGWGPRSVRIGICTAAVVFSFHPELMSKDSLRDEKPGPELSNVAWFLSLVVMLLVVLRQKAQKEGTAGEYRRGAKSPKIHTLKQEGIAWQAWVSDQARM